MAKKKKQKPIAQTEQPDESSVKAWEKSDVSESELYTFDVDGKLVPGVRLDDGTIVPRP